MGCTAGTIPYAHSESSECFNDPKKKASQGDLTARMTIPLKKNINLSTAGIRCDNIIGQLERGNVQCSFCIAKQVMESTLRNGGILVTQQQNGTILPFDDLEEEKSGMNAKCRNAKQVARNSQYNGYMRENDSVNIQHVQCNLLITKQLGNCQCNRDLTYERNGNTRCNVCKARQLQEKLNTPEHKAGNILHNSSISRNKGIDINQCRNSELLLKDKEYTKAMLYEENALCGVSELPTSIDDGSSSCSCGATKTMQNQSTDTTTTLQGILKHNNSGLRKGNNTMKTVSFMNRLNIRLLY